MDYARLQLADALAAEYVAGTLRGAARNRFESLLPGHPSLRAAVRDWQARLMPLTTAVVPEQPPTRVWQALERKLWPAAAPAAAPSSPLPWWRRLGIWQSAAGLATVAALALALVLANPPLQPPVLVVLQSTGADGRPAGLTGSFVASVSGDGRSLVTQPVQPVSVPEGRALELWSVPPDGAPRSLGVIGASGTTVLARDRLPATLLKGGTAALAVTVEPPGGSPTGGPTGPVVYAGKLTL